MVSLALDGQDRAPQVEPDRLETCETGHTWQILVPLGRRPPANGKFALEDTAGKQLVANWQDGEGGH